MPSESKSRKLNLIKRSMSLAEAQIVARNASDFHDAGLVRVSNKDRGLLLVEVRNLWWELPNGRSKLDKSTRFLIRMKGVSITESWGSDEDICLSIINDFSIKDDRFYLSTGDGHRSGVLDISKSVAEITTTPHAIVEFNLPV